MPVARVFRLVAFSSLLAVGLAACGGASADGIASGEDDATRSLFKIGTYALDGAPDHWVMKRLAIREDSAFAVEMYPGRAFPIESIRTTTGTYAFARGKLTLKLESGNDFATWSVVRRGDKLAFHDEGEQGPDFEMKYVSSATVLEPEVRGTDPGMPAAIAGGRTLTCQALYGDIRANLVVTDDGVGKMHLSSSSSLGLSGVEKVSLGQERDRESTGEWLLVSGDGNPKDGKRYLWNIRRSLLATGAKEAEISMRVGAQAYEDAEEKSWTMICDVAVR